MPSSDAQALTITTYQGLLKGAWADQQRGIRAFKGIPYAAPPVGDLRWRPPQAPANWTGVRDATVPGPACWQPTDFEQFVWSRGSFDRSEDCLYLNLWSGSSEDNAAPVMVWFHGGAHTAGMAHEQIFDGAELAARGVVLVSVNYRLGPLGFLAHPALRAESAHDSSGNYGLLDKMAALNWVRDNIAQFGGDPGNITIFGQSAGSQSVCALMASPLARGLFHKAIGQSAACVDPRPMQDPDGTERGTKLIAALGNDLSIEQMRGASPAQLLQAAEQVGWGDQSRITVDGWVLQAPPDQTFAQAQQAAVPLLLGSLSNEGNQLLPLNEALTGEALQAYMRRIAGDQAEAILEHYADIAATSPGLAQRKIATDQFLTYGMRRWALHQQKTGAPVFLYYMDHHPPAFRLYVPDDPDLGLEGGPRSAGAYHSSDLAYVFANTRKVGMDWQPRDHALADQIATMWTNFAKQGDPNGPGLPAWLPFDPERMSTLLITEGRSRAEPGVRREILDLWDQRFADP